MNAKDVKRAVTPVKGVQKILFVTNFVESSGTILNVQNIIITGWELRTAYDPQRQKTIDISGLELGPICA